MRCNYCGMQNDDNSTVCANPNCGKPLSKSQNQGGQIQPQPSVVPHRPTVLEPGGNLVEPQPNQSYGQQPQTNCKKCNYPLHPSTTVCPNCNTPVKGNAPQPAPNLAQESNHRPTVIGSVDSFQPVDPQPQNNGGVVFNTPDSASIQNNSQKPKVGKFSGTVNPYVQRMLEIGFTLCPIKKENERHDPEELSFSGEEVILNRGNLEQNNMSITSRTQATVTNEDGKFYIIDGSDFKTTFVQAKNKTEIHDGDIILMGDRMFEFHTN